MTLSYPTSACKQRTTPMPFGVDMQHARCGLNPFLSCNGWSESQKRTLVVCSTYMQATMPVLTAAVHIPSSWRQAEVTPALLMAHLLAGNEVERWQLPGGSRPLVAIRHPPRCLPPCKAPHLHLRLPCQDPAHLCS